MDENLLGPEALLPGILSVSLYSGSGGMVQREVLLNGTPTSYSTFQRIPLSAGTYRVSLAGNDYSPPSETVTILSGTQATAEFHQ
jgi:hypothetical protein